MSNSICQNWDEIHGFKSLGEYERFVKYIESQKNRNMAKEIIVDLNYHKGLIYGGRWFQCSKCKAVWRLVEPDFPFKGLWEPVDIRNSLR